MQSSQALRTGQQFPTNRPPAYPLPSSHPIWFCPASGRNITKFVIAWVSGKYCKSKVLRLSFRVLRMGWIRRVCKQLVDVAFFVNCSSVFVYFRVFEWDGSIAYGAQHDLLLDVGLEELFIKQGTRFSSETCRIFDTGKPRCDFALRVISAPGRADPLPSFFSFLLFR